LPTLNGVRHAQEAIPFLMRDMVRGFIGPDWQPDWIEIPSPTAPNYADFGFPVPVRCHAERPGIAIPNKILHAPNPNSARTMLDLSDLPRLTGLRRPRGLADRVRAVLPLQAEQRDLSVEAVSERLALGVRSLERQLQAENTSFRHIKQDFLRDRACKLLAKPGAKPDEIATALGYREPNSFRRAFRNWTGQTPSAFAATQ
jgi:AraC-like DNA-binding protein